MRSIKYLSALAAGIFMVIGPAQAAPFSHIIGSVTRVEASIPANLYFQVDAQAGNCQPGSWLYYTPTGTDTQQPDNMKAAYVLLMSALLAGKQVALYGNDSPTPNNLCQVTAIDINS